MKMKEGHPHPGISMHKLPVGAGVAESIFAVGMMIVFLIKLPVLWAFFVPSIVVGGAIALFLRRINK